MTQLSIIADAFYFNQKSSEDFHLILCESENSSNETRVTEYRIDSSDLTMSRPEPICSGLSYSDVLKLNLFICKDNFSAFTESDIRGVSSWLTSPSSPEKISFSGCANPIFEHIHYYGLFSKIERYDSGGQTFGLTLLFQTTAPYGYSDETIYDFSVSESSRFQINNTSDEQNTYYYPTCILKSLANQTVTIINHSDKNRTSTFKMVKDQTLKIYNYESIEDDTGIFTLDDFNFIWLRLKPDINDIEIKGNCTGSFICEYPRKVGGA